MSHIVTSTGVIDKDTLVNYGVSRQRSGIVSIDGSNAFSGDNERPVANASFLTTLKTDMTRLWYLYHNGSPGTGIQLRDDDSNTTLIQKGFFVESSNLTYTGVANYGSYTNGGIDVKNQHVMILDTTTDMQYENILGSYVNQSYRLRFEFDLRQRLYSEDAEFIYELYQLNIMMRQRGLSEYADGAVVDESVIAPDGRTGVGEGYDFSGTLSAGWETFNDGMDSNTAGIPNPMYGWLKLNIATPLQLNDNGTISKTTSTDNNELISLSNGMYLDGSVIRMPGELVDLEFNDTVYPYDDSAGAINMIKTRTKTKGRGWFKRFGKLDPTVQGTYPMSYRLTMSERGFSLALWDDTGSTENDDYAWVVSQRLVNNVSGVTRTDSGSRFPVHCLYSCSRASLYPRDFGIFYASAAISSHDVNNEQTVVYDYVGNAVSLDHSEFNTSTNKNAYILDPFDKEDPLSSNWLAKPIWRYVVREYDRLKPWDIHKSATKHETDSNAILNPMEQLAITDDNRFVITFPTGLTTQSFMYPSEEIDLICFSSAQVIAEGSTVPMTSYHHGENIEDIDKRRYYGLRSTLPNGNGMRVCMLVSGDWILNTDISLDVH